MNFTAIHSIQDGTHRQLPRLLERHLEAPFRRPIAPFNRIAFEHAVRRAERIGGGIVLDSGCGTGASTAILAGRFPGCTVIGVDKSAVRLARARHRPPNCVLLRAHLVDFWRLATEAGWRLERQ